MRSFRRKATHLLSILSIISQLPYCSLLLYVNHRLRTGFYRDTESSYLRNDSNDDWGHYQIQKIVSSASPPLRWRHEIQEPHHLTLCAIVVYVPYFAVLPSPISRDFRTSENVFLKRRPLVTTNSPLGNDLPITSRTPWNLPCGHATLCDLPKCLHLL